jgi:hypothetical protein
VTAGGAAKIIIPIKIDGAAMGAGTLKTLRLPYGVLLSEVRASGDTAGGGDSVIDITVKQTEAGMHASILSAPLQVDTGETTSVGSAAPAAILTHELNDNAEVKIVGTTDGGLKGLTVYLIGTWAGFGIGQIPYFVANGAQAGSYNVQTANVPYPAGLQLDDIAILEVRTQGLAATTTPAISRPGGWTAIANPVGPSGSTAGDPHSDVKSTAAWFWKRLAGTEVGTVAAMAVGGDGASQGVMGRMSLWRGCVQNGDPFESAASASGDSTTLEATSIVTLGPNRLAVNFYNCVEEDATDPDTGWTEIYDDTLAFAIGGQQRSASVLQMAVAGATPAEVRTVGDQNALVDPKPGPRPRHLLTFGSITFGADPMNRLCAAPLRSPLYRRSSARPGRRICRPPRRPSGPSSRARRPATEC